MKKITAISVTAIALTLSGCWNDTKEAVSEASSQATQSVKEAVSVATDTAKEKTTEAMDKVAQKAKEVANNTAQTAKNAVSNTVDTAKASIENAVSAAAPATAKPATDATASGDGETAPSQGSEADTQKGKALYAKCAGCHGADGKTKALGKSEVISGKSAEEIEKMLHEYKAGTRNVAGMGMLMKGQVAAMSDEDIKAISAYIATFK